MKIQEVSTVGNQLQKGNVKSSLESFNNSLKSLSFRKKKSRGQRTSLIPVQLLPCNTKESKFNMCVKRQELQIHLKMVVKNLMRGGLICVSNLPDNYPLYIRLKQITE